MTIDRDIRFTPAQVHYTLRAVRARRRQLGRSIAQAEANHRAGARIQRGTHERNIDELHELGQVVDALEVATREIQRRIRASLGMEEVS